MKHNAGVQYYTTGTVELEIPFPEDKITCGNCRLCRFDEVFKYYYCGATRDRAMILHPFGGVCEGCPIRFDGQEEKEEI